MRELFQVHPINLSVAVWVGFLALFGISDDDGVVMGTYLDQSFARRSPRTIAEIREATVEAGKRRIRACLMTTATTILALIPVLTSTGRGSDIMVPMAIPSFGGMTIEILHHAHCAGAVLLDPGIQAQAGNCPPSRLRNIFPCLVLQTTWDTSQTAGSPPCELS